MQINSINSYNLSFRANKIPLVKKAHFMTIQEYLANREEILSGYKPEFIKEVAGEMARGIRTFEERTARRLAREEAARAKYGNLQMTI